MRNQLFFSSLFVACGAFGMGGCGSLDGKTDQQTTLATVHGELSNPTAIQSGTNVHVAVVWQAPSGQYNITQDLPVQPVFPSSFTLHLTAPAPASANLEDAGSPFQAEYGFVIAYEDANSNGQLDLVQDSAGSFIDKIVGANTSLGVVFLTGDATSVNNITDSYGNHPSLGYNLFSLTACTDAPCDSLGLRTQWFSIDAPYDLVISADPEVNQRMCATYGQHSATSGIGSVWYVDQSGTPAGGYPAPGTPGVTCHDTGYATSKCQIVHTGLCSESNDCQNVDVELGSAAKPAGWPCP